MELPNGTLIQSTGQGVLRLRGLSDIPVLTFPKHSLQRSLVSIHDFTTRGCEAVFDDTSLRISHDDSVVLEGTKAAGCKLWTLCPQSLRPATAMTCHPAANHVITHQTVADAVSFWHLTLGSPTLPTLKAALQRGYISIPGLTVAALTANQPVSEVTHYGHLRKTRQHIRSTKAKGPPIEPAEVAPSPTGQAPGMCFAVQRIQDMIQSDQSGRLPRTFLGNQYLFVATYHGYIYISAQPTRDGSALLQSITQAYEYFDNLGYPLPSIHKMDNECSKEIREHVRKQWNINIEFVPPGNHRTLVAERAMQTAKDHLISLWAGTELSFKVGENWDRTLVQARITLNLLRPYAPDPSKSAYEGIHGHPYNFSRYPLAPVGTPVVVHERADQRNTWGLHGLDAHYLGPAEDHYRCWRVLVTSTKRERISDSLAWLLKPLALPGSQPAEIMQAAITDLTDTLQHLYPGDKITSFLPLHRTLCSQLRELHAHYHPRDTWTPPAELTSQTEEPPPEAPIQRVEEAPTPEASSQRVEAPTPEASSQRVEDPPPSTPCSITMPPATPPRRAHDDQAKPDFAFNPPYTFQEDIPEIQAHYASLYPSVDQPSQAQLQLASPQRRNAKWKNLCHELK